MSKSDGIPQNVKDVYNDHLTYTRIFHRKPFRPRKKFDNFQEDSRYKNYHQLAIWFDRHPEINRRLYFEAYLYYHPDKDAIPIKYYVHPKALTYYTKYRKVLESMDLSDTRILEDAVHSFKFIKEFCGEQNITFAEYLKFREVNNPTYSWLKHVKEGNVNIYVLFVQGEFFDILKNLYKDVDVWDFYIGRETPYFLLRRWHNSPKFQTLSTKAKNKLKNKQIL